MIGWPRRPAAPASRCSSGGHRGLRGAGVFGLPQRLLARLHPAPQQPRPARAVQVRRALVGPGRLAAVLVLAAGHLRTGAAAAPQGGYPPGGARFGHHCGRAGLLPAAGELRRPSVRAGRGHHSAGRQRTESAAAVSRDGDPSAHAVPRLRGHDRAVCLRAGGADHEVSRREVDSHHAPLDHGRLGVSDLRHLSGRALGLRGAGLGRLLGMGPGGERFAAALAHRHRVPAFGDDAGEARHDEGLEHVADLHHVPAGHLRHLPDALRRGQFGTRLCAVGHRHLVCGFPGAHLRHLRVLFRAQPRHLKSEHQLESLVSRESSFLFNNVLLLVSCFAVLWGTLFPVLSEWVQGTKVTVGPPFFNKVNVPIAMVLLLLTGVGPLLAWRKTSLESLKRNFLVSGHSRRG